MVIDWHYEHALEDKKYPFEQVVAKEELVHVATPVPQEVHEMTELVLWE